MSVYRTPAPPLARYMHKEMAMKRTRTRTPAPAALPLAEVDDAFDIHTEAVADGFVGVYSLGGKEVRTPVHADAFTAYLDAISAAELAS